MRTVFAVTSAALAALAVHAAADSVVAQQPPIVQKWEVPTPGGPRYVPGVDADERADGTALYWTPSDELRAVGMTGEQTVLPTCWPPEHDFGCAPQLASVESENTRYELTFDATASWDGGWRLPIPGATIRTCEGRLVSSVKGIYDEGWLSDDGRVLVSFAGRHSSAPSGPDILFFDGTTGARVGAVVDADADLGTSALATSGATFVHAVNGGRVTARSSRGKVLWTHVLPDGETVAKLHVNPDGTRVLVQSLAPRGVGESVRVLGAGGKLVGSVPSHGRQYHRVRFAPDGARALLISGSRALVVALASGTVSWQGAPADGFLYFDGDIANGASGWILSAVLRTAAPKDPSSAHPAEWTLELYKSAARVGGATLPRDDGDTSRPSVTGPVVELADDGGYALVATAATLRLFATPGIR